MGPFLRRLADTVDLRRSDLLAPLGATERARAASDEHLRPSRPGGGR